VDWWIAEIVEQKWKVEVEEWRMRECRMQPGQQPESFKILNQFAENSRSPKTTHAVP
jgi:hypothetical protein